MFVIDVACVWLCSSFRFDLGWLWSGVWRGFCSLCGSQLFWALKDASHISIMAGALDSPTGLKAREHIFVAEAGDYYSILDDLPQRAGWS